jgi:hypothetical protein
VDTGYMRSRVRTRKHGSVGRREPKAPSDPIRGADFVKPLVPSPLAPEQGARPDTAHRSTRLRLLDRRTAPVSTAIMCMKIKEHYEI